VEKNKRYFEVDHNKYRFTKDVISLIKDFEKLAKKYKKHLRFCILVDKKNDVSRGLGHNLGVFGHVSLPTLRIMKFGEYRHVLKRRQEALETPNPEFKKKFHHDKKKKNLHELKEKWKTRHKTREERKEHDHPANHPAHKTSKREIKKFKSDDLSLEGMETFIKEFIQGKTVHYHRSDHIPHNNHKLIVKHLNSHNYEAFLEEAKLDKKMAIIWTCVKGAFNYPDFYKQIKHLAKHSLLKKHFKFGKIDPFKNDRPVELKGNAHMDKLFIYKDETNVGRYWKQVKYEDMATIFKYLAGIVFELDHHKRVEEEL
jgi:hypothetical protein